MTSLFFFFNDTATTEIYTLSLHDALPISDLPNVPSVTAAVFATRAAQQQADSYKLALLPRDRKSTRLNSSHQIISYAVFCLKKKKIEHGINSIVRVTHTSFSITIPSTVTT